MDGLYKSIDRYPETATLTSLPALVDGLTCVGVNAYWTNYRSLGIDLGGTGTIEWIQIHGRRADETPPTSWYTNANQFSVYKSDNNIDWTLVQDYTMQAEDINHVSGSCAWFVLVFTEAHTARYFKVVATGGNGGAWNADGGSIDVCEMVAAADYQTKIQYFITGRHPGARLGRPKEQTSRFGFYGRTKNARLDRLFSQRFNISAHSLPVSGVFLFRSPVRFGNLVRSLSPEGVLFKPCRAEISTAARSGRSALGLPAITRARWGTTIQGGRAKLGRPHETFGRVHTTARSVPADSHRFFGIRLTIPIRSREALASGRIPTRTVFFNAVRSLGRGTKHFLGRERILYSLIGQGHLLIDGGLGLSGRQKVIQTIAAGRTGRQRLLLVLSEASTHSRQRICQTLDLFTTIAGRQRLLQDLAEEDLQIFDPLDWDVLLDGKFIKNSLIDQVTITCSQNDVHNEMTIESMDPDLYEAADPLEEGVLHLFTVCLGDRQLAFMLSHRQGTEDRFTLTGLSNSIQIDAPYQVEISFNQDYEVLDFTSGQYEIAAGQIVTGHVSHASGKVVRVTVTKGLWDTGTAQGRIYLDDVEGDFLEEGLDLYERANAAFTDGRLTTISLGRPASEVAGDMAVNLILDWDEALPDWVLPPDTQMEGYPIDIIQELAQAAGGIVRCLDNGNILVRPRFPIRPVDIASQTPAARYDRTRNMIQADLKERTGTGHNAIEVNGYAEESRLPRFEFETPEGNRDREVGEDLFARVYWTTEPPFENEALNWTSAGEVEYLGRHTEQIHDEQVLFDQGRATVGKPIFDLDPGQVKWIGSQCLGIGWEPHSHELKLKGADEKDISTLFRVARVTYTAQYDRYRVKNHHVEALLMALEIPTAPAVAVKVRYDSGPESRAEAVDAPLLTTLEAAACRGRAELDRSCYDTKIVRLLAPYDEAVTDGGIVEISDDRLGIGGNFHVTRAVIRIRGAMVLHELECLQPQI